MPFSFAGLLRLARFCWLHHSSVLIGLPPRVNVTSLSLTLVVKVVVINCRNVCIVVFTEPIAIWFECVVFVTVCKCIIE